VGEKPKLSVIMPIFGAEGRVSKAVESVLAQGVEGIEIICIDDCSPDNSATEVEKMQGLHTGIRLLRNKENRGPGGSTNYGIEEATGDYIVIVHADDALTPGALEEIGLHLAEHPSDVVLLGCEELRRGRLRPLTAGPLLDHLGQQPQPLTASETPRVMFWPPGPWSKAYRRSFLLDNNIRFPEGVFEDIPWSVQTILEAETISVVPGTQYQYVTSENESSITTSLNSRNLDRLKQIQLVRNIVASKTLTPELLTHVSAVVTIHLIWANRAAYKTLPPEAHKGFYSASAKELSWWHDHYPVPPGLDTTPLMSAVDRHSFSRALLADDWNKWLGTLEAAKAKKKFRRMFRPGRIFGRPA
jgi:glycosyltransferase involved in cell wall biosynthesis